MRLRERCETVGCMYTGRDVTADSDTSLLAPRSSCSSSSPALARCLLLPLLFWRVFVCRVAAVCDMRLLSSQCKLCASYRRQIFAFRSDARASCCTSLVSSRVWPSPRVGCGGDWMADRRVEVRGSGAGAGCGAGPPSGMRLGPRSRWAHVCAAQACATELDSRHRRSGRT